MTAGSPKPASAWSRSSTPVAHSASATPRATIATGSRSHTNTTTAAASTMKLVVASLIPDIIDGAAPAQPAGV
jgi:hypothetical protein